MIIKKPVQSISIASGRVRYSHFAPASDPDIQNSALCKPKAFGAESLTMSVIPSIIIETATPDRRSCVMLILPRIRDIMYTKIIVTADPIKALIESEKVPKNEKMPKSMPKVANADAPEDTPSIKGSASLFLTRACIVTPVTDKEAPTIIPRSTRGKRKPITIFISTLLALGLK